MWFRFSGEEQLRKEIFKECDQLVSSEDHIRVVAAKHLKIVTQYYLDVRKQASASFWCAVVLAILGFAVLVATMFLVMMYPDSGYDLKTIGIVSGVLIEFISAVVFFIYKRSTEQFNTFHVCLERTNRYLMAYDIINGMSDDTNRKEGGARHDLACIIANAPMIRQKEDGITHTIRPPQPEEAPLADTRGQPTSPRGDTLWSQPNQV